MTEKQNQPREYDAVLGGKNPPPVNAAVLGGIEGVKRRLTANDELVRVAAVRDAIKYGEAGLDVAIASLKDNSPQVRRAAIYLLQEKPSNPKVKPLLTKGKLVIIYREEFETVTINARAEIIKREGCQADYFAENLGDGVGLEMVSIPGGSFLMGSPLSEEGRSDWEGPQHRVKVPPFFLGRYPVTQQQYEAVMGKNPSHFKGANRPVETVSWNDATEFCQRLSQKTGKIYRLPSEAEWEYACRAGTTTPFYFGPTITTNLVNYCGKYTYVSGPKGIYREQTTDVGSFPPNAFGLYDMHGNVWEWCQDVWHSNYHGALTDGSAWESGGDSSRRMQRGGSWFNYPRNCRCAYRDWNVAGYWDDYFVGFRVVFLPEGDSKDVEKRSVSIAEGKKFSAPPVKPSVTSRKTVILPVSAVDFETVTVNARGEIIKREPRQAEAFVENLGLGVELEMVSIPGGSFLMGSPENEEGRSDWEGPQHRVNVPPFFLGRYPITQKQYEAVMGKNPSYFKGANRPVEYVTWDDATEFCRRLSQKTGKIYRLPSEAEWEYACRAGTTTPFYFGETITTDLVNYDGNYAYASAPKGVYREKTTDVGSFPQNGFGLYDMHGNVSEWCQDVWHENYNGAPTDGSAWVSGGNSSRRMLRGGSWRNDPRNCRCAKRGWGGALICDHYYGFRVVLLAEGDSKDVEKQLFSVAEGKKSATPSVTSVTSVTKSAANKSPSPTVNPSVTSVTKSATNKSSVPTSVNNFEIFIVNARGEIIKREPRQAEAFVENLGLGVELEMVSIPGGSFLMGSPENEEGRSDWEGPQHRVNVPPFFLGRYPITQKQYEAVMGKNPSYFKGANRPVEYVTWDDATEFCRRLSQKTGKIYRLPSEAEWEYACRAGTTTPFYFGETITTDLVNYDGNYAYASAPKGVYREKTTDVGSFPQNGFGLYDMHGNVSEWCQDVWHENYNGAPTDGSAWVSGGNSSRRMLRGGSWRNDPRNCRCAKRGWGGALICDHYYGFRVVLLAEGDSKDVEKQLFSVAEGKKSATPSVTSVTSVTKSAANKSPSPTVNPSVTSALKSAANKSSVPTSVNNFETVTVNARGEIIKREPPQAEVFVENLGGGVELEMVSIHEGSFLMGSPLSEKGRYNRESPQHRVKVPPFFLGKYPVTQKQYEAVMEKNPSRFKGANRPVETVTWNDATEFCRRLSHSTGKTYRLPSEAEWEYACRAGTTTPFYFGETITTDLVNYKGNKTYGSAPKGVYRKETTDVGSFPPNAFGLYDMHGNVWEWCQDVWHDNYNGAPTDGSAWESGGDSSDRLLRGGSWLNDPWNCRSAVRHWVNADLGFNVRGFRVVLLPEGDSKDVEKRPKMVAEGTKSATPPVKPSVTSVKKSAANNFETVTVNARGEVIKREPRQAEVFVEDLGGGVKLEMVSIPSGSFLIGSPLSEKERSKSESPQHRVNVPPFFLGKYPVTQKQYEAVMGKNPSYFKGPNRPVEIVTWNDATEFCRRLSQKTGKTYRLPSEAEWEYACRAGTTTPFYFGETITTDLVNYRASETYGSAPKGVYRKETTDVGSFPPNAFGLYDMHGNVWEWCQDMWHGNYNGGPTNGSAWESGWGLRRLLRGGSWFKNPGNCRSANRIAGDAAFCFNSEVGFRVVLLSGV